MYLLSFLQYGEEVEFIDEVLRGIDIIINDLQPQQVNTFYEAIGVIISAHTDPNIEARQIEGLFRLPNQVGGSSCLSRLVPMHSQTLYFCGWVSLDRDTTRHLT